MCVSSVIFWYFTVWFYYFTHGFILCVILLSSFFVEFFFFFKQKTAYDMRISDWSSDVCSSDLLQSLNQGEAAWNTIAIGLRVSDSLLRCRCWQQRRRSPARGRRCLVRATGPAKCAARTGACSTARKWRCSSSTAAGRCTSTQIGRATGRERVCQYV